MLNTGIALENREIARTATLSSMVGPDTQVRPVDVQPHRSAAERAIDEVLAESFPASDPPSWNAGIVRPDSADPVAGRSANDESRAEIRKAAASPIGIVDAPRPVAGQLTFLDIASSVGGACGIVLLVPVVVLLIGSPIALSIRALIEAVGWLAAAFSS